MVPMSLFCRMILSRKSASFWDHALAAHEHGNKKTIGAARQRRKTQAKTKARRKPLKLRQLRQFHHFPHG